MSDETETKVAAVEAASEKIEANVEALEHKIEQVPETKEKVDHFLAIENKLGEIVSSLNSLAVKVSDKIDHAVEKKEEKKEEEKKDEEKKEEEKKDEYIKIDEKPVEVKQEPSRKRYFI